MASQNPNALVGRTAKQPAGESPQSGGTFVSATGGNPPTLDPHRSSSGAAADAVSPAMSRLFRFKPGWEVQSANNHDVEPDLGISVESPDASTWTVKLRQGVKFQNIAPVSGHAVDSQDIKATFQRATDPSGANRGSLDMIDPAQIETPTPDTMVLKLRYPYAPFVKTLASPSYSWILPREALAGSYDPGKVMIGSGPFIFDKYTPDVAVEYRRNPDYWETGKPYVDGVKWAIVPSASRQLAEIAAGNLDYILNLSQDDVPTATAQNPGADVVSNWGPGDGQIHFPWAFPNSKFADIRVRQAISLAIDRDALAKVAFNNACIPTFYAPQSLGRWALKMEDLPPDTAQYYKFDLARAKQLLRDAGADGMTVKYVSPTPLPPSGEANWLHVMREAVFNMLSALPWQISMVLIDYNKDWVGGGKGVRYGIPAPDTIVYGPLEGRTDVDEYIYGWYAGSSSTNMSHLNDAALNSMISDARKIVSESDRAKAYIEIQKYMAKQLFSVAGNPNGLAYYMVKPAVRNYVWVDAHSVGESAWSNLWLKRG
jgi:ABC-type transport system substrate-binding protein